MSWYIKQLIDQGEHLHLDFKYAITDAKKLARTCSAFANTSGGKLLIGVKDNGTIAGVKTDEEAYMMESAAHVFCKPLVNYSLKNWTVDSKQILEIDIPESAEKPHIAPWKEDKWKAFVRLKDENFVANSIQVAVWKKLRAGKPTLVKYNSIEEQLLHYLANNPEISLNQFCRLSNIKYHKAKKVLVNLAAIGVIDIIHRENSAVYQLNPELEI